MKPNFLPSRTFHKTLLPGTIYSPTHYRLQPFQLLHCCLRTDAGRRGKPWPAGAGAGLDAPGSGWAAGAAAVWSCCWGWRSRVQATSQLKSWWGNGNFPPVLGAASDPKTTAPASPDAEQEQACKCDMTAQDTPIWLPAVRPPPGRTGWEGDAPVTDAFGGEEGGLGQGQVQACMCRQAHAAQCRVAGTGTTTHPTETNPPGSRQSHPGRVLGHSPPDAGGYPVPPQLGFEEPCPRLQGPQQAPSAQGAPPAATLTGSCTGPSCARQLRQLSPLQIKQIFVNLN